MSERFRSLRALIPAALGFIVVTGALLVGIHVVGLERLRELIAEAGPLAPLVYIAVKVVTFVVAPLSSGPIQLSAGVLFGWVPGTLYTLLGEVIGGCINFWLARRFGRPIVLRLVGAKEMPRVEAFVSKIVDWKTLLYARLFLFSIYDFISYAAGFARLRFRHYLVVSILGGILPTTIGVLLGTGLTADSSSFLLIYALIGVASVIPLLLQKRIRRLLRLDDEPKLES
ncbi:MAG: TVP38/TMEM64 family protein [Anaerolineae bacterium]|nr:TVP38/TMEM64 family protein [Anaerolineae bacterium]